MKNVSRILSIALMLYTNHLLYSNTFEEYQTLYYSGKNNSVAEALEGFKRLAKKSPRHENIADMEYIIAQNEKDYKKSLTLLRKLYKKRKNFSKRDELAYSLAGRYMLQNGFKEASQLLTDIEKIYPNSEYYIPSKLMLGSIYLKLNDNDKAIAKYNEVINLYSTNIKVINANANSDNKLEQHYHNALFGLANSYFAKEEYYLALGTYNRLLDIDKNFNERAFVLYRSALCYEYTDRTPQALNIYKMIVDVYKNTQSRTLANQRLSIHEAIAEAQALLYDNDDYNTADDSVITIEDTPLEKPTIYESDSINTYQFGRFRSVDKCTKMLDIIESLGYNAYILENNSLFVVLLDVYDDERNIEELRSRCNRAGIPFFRIK